MTDVIIDAHISGAPVNVPYKWRRQVRVALDEFPSLSVGALTECRTAFYLPGYNLYVPGIEPGTDNSVECAVFWDPEVWSLIASGTVKVTDRTWLTGKGGVRQGVTMTWVLLRHYEGWTYLRPVMHLPASVQRGSKWSTNARRVVAWMSAVAGARRAVRRLRKKYKPDEISHSFDANLDLARKVWRAAIRAISPGKRFRVVVPNRGTLGIRRIDGFLSTLKAVENWVLDGIEPFNHRILVVAFKRRPKKSKRGGGRRGRQ